MLSSISFCIISLFSSKANTLKSSKSFNFFIDVSNEFIRSSYSFFSFITFFELALSCQKLGSSILELWFFNFE